MTPFDRVGELYEKYQQTRTFDEDIAAHIETGYVISTPEYFIMGRAIDRFASESAIQDPWHSFPLEHQNTWLVWAFAGSSRNFLRFVPYSLTWVAWSRRNKPLRVYEFEKIKRCVSMTLSLTQ